MDGSGLTVEQALKATGFAVLRDAQPIADIDQALEDYDAWLAADPDPERNRDAQGRPHRVTNLHLGSDAAMRLAKNPSIMKVLDRAFGREASVHSSLTFRYSTQQAMHRDTPFFHTSPPGLFYGVWTAMEDVHADAGPLRVVPQSHRLSISADGLSLDEYLYTVRLAADTMGGEMDLTIRKGDVVIWHPNMIHGGAPAVRPDLTRKSMVVHCVPTGVPVHGSDVFLSDEMPDHVPYGYGFSHGRTHADLARPDFMGSI